MKVNFKSVNLGKLAFELSQEFGETRFDMPERPRFGVTGGFILAGCGEKGSLYCGRHVSFKGCLNVHLHNIITLDGVNYSGKVFVRKIRFSCGKPSCPTCYKRWAYREAGNITSRLEVSAKHFGVAEHLTASIPVRDYGIKDMKVLRARTIKALKVRGVIGGCLIFHPFRYNLRKLWYFSPHWHVVGHILGGFRKCRRCPYVNEKGTRWRCKGCEGFYGVSKECFKKDGYIVEVFEKRKASYYTGKPNIFGTAYYQLGHCGIKKDVKNFRAVTWFGVCSYRKLKVTVEVRKDICPICQHELIWIRYLGSKIFNTDGDSPDYEVDTYENFVENDRIVWVEIVKRSFYGNDRLDRMDGF